MVPKDLLWLEKVFEVVLATAKVIVEVGRGRGVVGDWVFIGKMLISEQPYDRNNIMYIIFKINVW